jgi:hypothetical protein
MGRPIKLTENMKRWYDIPLTDEEIILGVCNDFVSIGVSASFDFAKNPPLVDAVEVYAQERTKLCHLFPISKEDSNTDQVTSITNGDKSTAMLVSEVEANRDALTLSIFAVTYVCYLLGKIPDQATYGNSKTLCQLIQVTRGRVPTCY